MARLGAGVAWDSGVAAAVVVVAAVGGVVNR